MKAGSHYRSAVDVKRAADRAGRSALQPLSGHAGSDPIPRSSKS
jgi:hypothetical protein